MTDRPKDSTDPADGMAAPPTLSNGEPPQTPVTQSQRKHERTLAFRAIFETELKYVWNTLRYLGVRSDDLRDVAQEVFLTVFQRFDDYDPSRSVRTWLFVIAYHAASNYRRLARHHREVLGSESEPAAADPNVEQLVAAREQSERLIQMLDQIDLDKRAVLVMHDMDGIAMPEIAASLSIPLNTAYSRLRLARGELQERAQRCGGLSGAEP